MQTISTNFDRVPDFGKLQKLPGLSKISWVGNRCLFQLSLGCQRKDSFNQGAVLTTET